MITSVPKSNTPSGTQKSTKGTFALKSEDFIKMMVTQLQNQDPLSPAKNEELLAQMSQIGQLQSSTQLQESLQNMSLQNQIGSASSLIGKEVKGLDKSDDPVSGLVNSIRVEDGKVQLELDSGKSLALERITDIAPGHTGTGAAK